MTVFVIITIMIKDYVIIITIIISQGQILLYYYIWTLDIYGWMLEEWLDMIAMSK